MKLIIPKNYDPVLTVRETQEAIKYIRDTFQYEFGKELNLSRISAPLYVTQSSGLNDNLNGTEKPVSFTMKELPGEQMEVVHSLAKWKRMALKKYGFKLHEGLYTNMNAIRKDEELDNFHSAYVDQWDWEKIISKNERTKETLVEHVRTIFKVIKHMEHEVWYKYPQAVNNLPVFVMQIGDKLSNNEKHDGRAPDYDDWTLNGDILFWYEPLQSALEISSMGIRVDEDTLLEQLKKENCLERCELPFHKAILNKELPYTLGGGIGQSRLCMLLLKKAHIGEVQASLWPEVMVDTCLKNNIQIL